MRYVWTVLAAINLLVLLWIVICLPAPAGGAKLSYDQFISISLTVMTIVLAVVALLMAYLAFEGKSQIIEKAREMAKQEVEKNMPAFLDAFRKDARDGLNKLVRQEGDLIYKDLAGAGDKSASNFDGSRGLDDLKEAQDE